jgi:hypothetical protein
MLPLLPSARLELAQAGPYHMHACMRACTAMHACMPSHMRAIIGSHMACCRQGVLKEAHALYDRASSGALQGQHVSHCGRRAFSAKGERITMVTSYRPADPCARDASVLRGPRQVSDCAALYHDWARYRLASLSAQACCSFLSMYACVSSPCMRACSYRTITAAAQCWTCSLCRRACRAVNRSQCKSFITNEDAHDLEHSTSEGLHKVIDRSPAAGQCAHCRARRHAGRAAGPRGHGGCEDLAG